MKPRTKSTLLIVGLCTAGILTGMLVIYGERIRCGSFDGNTARTNDAAKQWLHFWPSQFDWDLDVADSRWKPVVPSRRSAAESALSTTGVVPLTEVQVLDFTGESSPQLSMAHPYLLRSVVAAKHDAFRVEIHARSRN